MTINVTQLNNYIRGIIDIDGVLGNVSVCGEITNIKKSRDGWYFSLKDDSAAVNCFCYDSLTVPEAGNMVVAEGQINYFTRTGSLSFFVRRLTSTLNTGTAYLRFVELKEKLEKEGLFDESRKRVVPKCCRKVGVVTSQTGAVIHDITNVCLRRQPFTDLILYSVKVQGDGASEEIAAGIDYFNTADVDVVIVGRGGGSNEDLSVFNSEVVVRAVANCNKPIVSAVGHGVDFTLCDFAADRRAVTPSEAAEFVTIDSRQIKDKIYSLLEHNQAMILARLKSYFDKVNYDTRRVNADIAYNVEQTVANIRQRLYSIQNSVELRTINVKNTIDNNLSKIDSMNPVKVLQRGYAYISNNGNVVKSVDDIEVDSKIRMTLYDGEIYAKVIDKVKK